MSTRFLLLGPLLLLLLLLLLLVKTLVQTEKEREKRPAADRRRRYYGSSYPTEDGHWGSRATVNGGKERDSAAPGPRGSTSCSLARIPPHSVAKTRNDLDRQEHSPKTCNGQNGNRR
ncbi:hypothetical protein DAPPUDRAFT_108937 [Daphnia pulex]|uniref:Uncharacterized protein n=1 Tax=Daphnia pulex TaxID=6669 RepID=E9H1A4_DAPPU|nr:hypothetical protein DAPPUDRAFT_108937 [Daphnia pulex]|eukprot:EFX74451.1 hypothetical protein DAPPUDRAFT_108937 [Daphnia pulex]